VAARLRAQVVEADSCLLTSVGTRSELRAPTGPQQGIGQNVKNSESGDGPLQLDDPHDDERKVKPARLAIAVATVVASTVTWVAAASPVGHAVGPEDWLGTINTYRAQSGLAPVTENGSWSAGSRAHSCWMLLNGIAHDEQPGTAGYSTAGDQAGNSGNVAVSSSAAATSRSHIDLWMSGPFHAIGVLRPELRQAGFGLCESPPNPTATRWRSAATLDVIRGLDGSAPAATAPVVFPGDGATTSLTRFVAESPDPRTFCGWSGRTVGLPLIALMPGDVSSATATLTGPNGPVPTCVLHRQNTSGVASSILAGDNAVVIVPDAPLVTGTYKVSVGSTGGNTAWSFKVDPTAPLTATLAAPESTKVVGDAAGFEPTPQFRFADSREGKALNRLRANRQVRIKIAGRQGLPADITAVSANFTVVRPDGSGYLTASNCSAGKGTVSTLNYAPGETMANQALIPLDDGHLCLYSLRNTDVVIDVNGYVSPGASQEFMPVLPKRILDSRKVRPLTPGTVTTLRVEGGSSPVPTMATAVAVNLTGVSAQTNGWIRAYPCDRREPGVSSVNPRFLQNRANSAIVPTSATGTICLTSNVRTHVVVDVTGWFGPTEQREFVPLDGIRMADTRSLHADLNPRRNGRQLTAGTVLKVPVAGVRGVPETARAASVNLVAVGSLDRGWIRVVPCGTTSSVSNLNYSSPSAIANGANVKLSSDGAICVTTNRSTHVIIDITGVWV